MNQHEHHIGGRSVRPSTGQYFDDLSPIDDSLYAQAALGATTDIGNAVEVANSAFLSHRVSTPSEREGWLLDTAELLSQHANDFIEILIGEIGSPIAKAEQEVATSVRILKAAAGAVRHVTGKTLPSDVAGRLSFSIRQPLGVIAGITPFNVPLIKAVKHSAMPLATGNSVVLLPSEEAPALAIRVAELYTAAGVPDGLFNVVTGRGAEIGDTLTTHPLVKMVSFTGSTRVGRHVGGISGRLGKRFTLEMGGKNPLIVLQDADMDKAVQAAVFGSFLYQGQICMASSRIFVERPCYKEFIQKFVAAAKHLGMGDLRDRSTVIGPIINERQREHVREHLEDAIDKGATVLCGGEWQQNRLVPTILTNVTLDTRLYSEETFGPVTSVHIVDSIKDAIAQANDTTFGLSAAVFTNNHSHAMQCVQKLNAGMVHINGSTIQEEPHAPFGGTGDSGFGREGTDVGIDELTEWKWVTMQMT